MPMSTALKGSKLPGLAEAFRTPEQRSCLEIAFSGCPWLAVCDDSPTHVLPVFRVALALVRSIWLHEMKFFEIGLMPSIVQTRDVP